MSSDALKAFEGSIKNDPERGLIAEHLLKKLESFDENNPEFYDRLVDAEWQAFLKGWNAAKEDSKPVAYLYCFDGFWYTAQSPEFDTKEKAIEWAIENGYQQND